MKETQRDQMIVKLKNEKEGNKFIKFLEENGFANSCSITYADLKIKILIVDLKDFTFFPTNVTCLAAALSVGIKSITVDEFNQLANLNEELTI